MFGEEWTSEYYDVMEFYYWEPQHLGKIKNKESRFNNEKKALQHIQNMEVSLNHLFNVFFRLTPSSFTHKMISEFFNKKIEEKFTLQGRYAVSKFSALVQPDLLLSSNETNLSIEMKIGAKSTLEQIYKYALLHWLEQNQNKKTKKSLLLYIGKDDFTNLWSERFSTIEELKKNVLSSNIEKLQNKASKVESVEINWDEVQDLVGKTIITYCSYSQFASFLKIFIGQISVNSEASETIEKLFNGLYCELERRQLI